MKLLALALLLVSVGTLIGCSSSAQSRATKAVVSVEKEPLTDTEVEAKDVHYCKGITVKGDRCKRHVKAEGDYCFQHKIQANPCWRAKGSKPKEDCYYEDGDVTRPIPGKP